VIETITPSSPILRKYIECFYLYKGSKGVTFNYIAFPHFNTGLSFFHGASIQSEEFDIKIRENINVGIHIEILGKYTSPIFINYSGQFNELSIIFKPIGINRFFREPYFLIAPQFSQSLSNIIWKRFGETLFKNQDDILLLEAFLLSQMEEHQDIVSIEQSLYYLENNKEEISIANVAESIGLNLKTFQRHFKLHMGCTPIEYKRICRFRSAVMNMLSNNEIKKLTEISYEEGYFDQAYFIKEFKKLTNHNPKQFFKVASKIDGDKIVWELI
jgi:AraC-like DNA-binding protein